MLQGTAQFMAYELLKASKAREPITHEVHHDIESFVSVFIYAIFVHDSVKSDAEHKDTNPQDWKKLDDDIQFIFGSTGLPKLAAARADLMTGKSVPIQHNSPLGFCVAMFMVKLNKRYSALLSNEALVR